MKTIKVEELKKQLEKSQVLLIDVREQSEHKDGYIAGAYLIPLSEISVEKLPLKSKPIVIYCKSGKRSSDACVKLLAQDPMLDLCSLDGGIIAWLNAGFNLKKSKILLLDRQTQIVVGFLAFSGTILGAFFDHKFYILSGFIGLALMFAGITGWCGIAKLLSFMPWNK